MASKYLQKYPVPQGFPDILHDFAREVLRDQPENIYEFGYLYFKAMEEVSYCKIILCRENHLNSERRARPSPHPRTESPTTLTTHTSPLPR
jgi:hypothetical protein